MSGISRLANLGAAGASTGAVSSLAASVTETPNARIRLYDFSAQDGQLDTLLDTYTQTSFLYDGVAFNGDNTKLVALKAGRYIEVHDISSNTLSLTSNTYLGHTQSGDMLAVAPDSDYFITANGTSGKFDLRSMSTPSTITDTYTNVTNSGQRYETPPAFSGDGSFLLVPDRQQPQLFGSVSGGSISLIDTLGYNLYQIRRCAISYDGTVAATTGRANVSTKQIVTYDVTSSSITQKDVINTSALSENYGCCLTPDGSYLFHMSTRTLYARNTTSLSQVADTIDLSSYIGSYAISNVTISSDGRFILISSYQDDTVVEWDGSSFTFKDNVVVSETHTQSGGPVVAFSWV